MVLALHPYVIGGLVVVFLAVSVILILTVLIQRPMGGGLSGAFGSGAGSGQTAFGAKTGDVLTLTTIIVFSVWILGAIGLQYVTRPPEAATQPTVSPTGGPAEDVEGTPTEESPGTPANVLDQPGEAEPPEDAPPPDDPAGDDEGAGAGDAPGGG